MVPDLVILVVVTVLLPVVKVLVSVDDLTGELDTPEVVITFEAYLSEIFLEGLPEVNVLVVVVVTPPAPVVFLVVVVEEENAFDLSIFPTYKKLQLVKLAVKILP